MTAEKLVIGLAHIQLPKGNTTGNEASARISYVSCAPALMRLFAIRCDCLLVGRYSKTQVSQHLNSK